MGAQARFLLQAPTYFTYHSPGHNNVITKSNIEHSINIFTCCSTRSRSNWDSNAESTASGSGRFRFNLEDELYTGDSGDFSKKPRSWWSDYDYDYDDDDWEFDEEDESWILKIFRAFGWMLPAIAIPLLLGTAPNALFMALIPLGQSVLSLAFDQVWGRTVNSPKSRPRAKRKRKPFARATSNTKTSRGKPENEAASGRSYQSWEVADGVSYEKRDKSGPRFGGWDDLDEKVGNQRHKAARNPPSQINSEQPKQQKKGKLSRMGRTREMPLLLRLLIAVFPFLGSWTKLLF